MPFESVSHQAASNRTCSLTSLPIATGNMEGTEVLFMAVRWK
ncbi:hypothetical protein CEV32_3029 [Brucella rhizosphaerae]|uniref:Uncharacterized protein n=1 Tax=Brucella rhizosphaerae TaxID=571254 RepID=A0A256FVA8_9HYPH|nr:hypothetical protein CEV32_3029 [Brucella rhizosphaerae]